MKSSPGPAGESAQMEATAAQPSKLLYTSVPEVQATSSRVGCLRIVSSGVPTNYDMLVFRTLNPLLKTPGHNADDLAPKIRDHLMPVRSWWLKSFPWAKYQLKNAMENRFWGVPGCTNFIDARTKWFDAAVISATASGIKQVVIVAAGYDTRAYRLAPRGGDIKFFEVDLPSASHRKADLVQRLKLNPPGVSPPVYVAADLSVVDLGTALVGTGFDPEKPSLFTVEGLIYYLPEHAALSLMARICRLAAPGSRVLFDFMHAAAIEGRPTSDNGFKYAGFKVTAKAVANKNEPYLFGLRDTEESVAAFLAAASKMAVNLKDNHDAGGQGQGNKGQKGQDAMQVSAVPAVPAAVGGLRLTQYMGPREMVSQQLPHLTWDDNIPPIASFYSYAAAVKM